MRFIFLTNPDVNSVVVCAPSGDIRHFSLKFKKLGEEDHKIVQLGVTHRGRLREDCLYDRESITNEPEIFPLTDNVIFVVSFTSCF